MRRAGVARTAAHHVVVLERETGDPPDIGTRVVNDELRPVGRVVDVIGPVNRPYVVVAPDEGVEPASVLDQTLYVR